MDGVGGGEGGGGDGGRRKTTADNGEGWQVTVGDNKR